jgi:RNA polymerase sigma-70 factor (ECF subfamily)
MLNTVELNNLGTAQAGDHEAFSHLTEPYRRELLVHCYRMLGSLQDAEDLVQETLLRAWRRLHTFERHVSFRAWLYKIATNACLDMLDKRPERTLPAKAYPASDPRALFAPPITEPIWLEPFSDDLLDDDTTGPEARYTLHESITLAFLVALQTLPPRQRAVLVMRDALDFSASEVAGILDLTVSAVNSALHRARVTLANHYRANEHDTTTLQAVNASIRALLDQYLHAWEAGDVVKLIGLLKEDAALTMPPSPSWYYGKDSIRAFLETFPFSDATRGQWRLQPIRANAQPAFELYLRDPSTNHYRSVAVQVLTFDKERIAEIAT